MLHRSVNLGIAVDLDYQGLVVPVIRGSDGLRLRDLGAAIRDVAARARAKQLGPDDLAGGTFTITNPGAARTWLSVPILNAPQVAILSTDGVSKRVVAGDRGGLRIAPVGNLCLTLRPSRARRRLRRGLPPSAARDHRAPRLAGRDLSDQTCVVFAMCPTWCENGARQKPFSKL